MMEEGVEFHRVLRRVHLDSPGWSLQEGLDSPPFSLCEMYDNLEKSNWILAELLIWHESLREWTLGFASKF